MKKLHYCLRVIQDVAQSDPKFMHWKIKKDALGKENIFSFRKNQSLEVHYMTVMQDRNAFVHVAVILQV